MILRLSQSVSTGIIVLIIIHSITVTESCAPTQQVAQQQNTTNQNKTDDDEPSSVVFNNNAPFLPIKVPSLVPINEKNAPIETKPIDKKPQKDKKKVSDIKPVKKIIEAPAVSSSPATATTIAKFDGVDASAPNFSECPNCSPYCARLDVSGFIDTLEPGAGFERPCPPHEYLFKGSLSPNITQIRADEAYLGFFGCLEEEAGLCVCESGNNSRCWAGESAQTSLDLFSYCPSKSKIANDCHIYAVVYEGRLFIEEHPASANASASVLYRASASFGNASWYPHLDSDEKTSLKIASISCRGCQWQVAPKKNENATVSVKKDENATIPVKKDDKAIIPVKKDDKATVPVAPLIDELDETSGQQPVVGKVRAAAAPIKKNKVIELQSADQ